MKHVYVVRHQSGNWTIGIYNLDAETNTITVSVPGFVDPRPISEFTHQIPVEVSERLLDPPAAKAACDVCPVYHAPIYNQELLDVADGGHLPTQLCPSFGDIFMCPQESKDAVGWKPRGRIAYFMQQMAEKWATCWHTRDDLKL